MSFMQHVCVALLQAALQSQAPALICDLLMSGWIEQFLMLG